MTASAVIECIISGQSNPRNEECLYSKVPLLFHTNYSILDPAVYKSRLSTICPSQFLQSAKPKYNSSYPFFVTKARISASYVKWDNRFQSYSPSSAISSATPRAGQQSSYRQLLSQLLGTQILPSSQRASSSVFDPSPVNGYADDHI
ncbi:hypothetical protein K2173_021735 [Erythroxylum novogranatense]|uniref:Uncharacterized protein n=1 Tax=Erythroxylum novogranatense TaxID=1862640 RepID=A0AAV8S5C8_9ROSI|nr:hypothetical protein K2173_021735 [Erythroxylum novogranatense]